MNTISEVNMELLKFDMPTDYFLIGDASCFRHQALSTWACLLLDKKGNGFILSDYTPYTPHTEVAELEPYLNALSLLKSQENLLDASTVMPTVTIITDSLALVTQYKTQKPAKSIKTGMSQLKEYQKQFHINMYHRKRRSHPTLSFVDSLARHLIKNHKNISKSITYILQIYIDALQMGKRSKHMV